MIYRTTVCRNQYDIQNNSALVLYIVQGLKFKTILNYSYYTAKRP